MAEQGRIDPLLRELQRLGGKGPERGNSGEPSGFPLRLESADGSPVHLELPEPPGLAAMDPDQVGAALVDSLGYPVRLWGLARRVRFFRANESCLLTEIGPLVQAALEGAHATLYFDGYRFYGSASESDGPASATVMVTYAAEEKLAKRQAHLASSEAQALKNIGRALNMNQSLVPLCYAAVHEIASVAGLAAVLLWVVDKDTGDLDLVASTGANRAGTAALARLSGSRGSSCVAELVAANRQPFFFPNVKSNVVTANLEGRFCYLEPGGVSVWPLVTGGNVIGILELVGRESDDHFEERLELFQTIAEHLALAMNSSMLFDSFERLASHDPLTGMANHRTLHEFLNLRLAESQRTHAEIGVIMIDVDHFRSFNEEEGHDTGDQVLKLVAETIKGVVRPYDLAARYGGEEFTVILPGSGFDATRTIAERIRSKVEAAPFETRTGRERHVTVSLGCGVYPSTASDAGSILRAADAALFEAKRAGRNRVVFFEGRFEGAEESEGIALDNLWQWLQPEEREAGRSQLERIEPTLGRLEKGLRLSKNQAQILRGLLITRLPYRDAIVRRDLHRLRALEKLAEFRMLEPAFLAMGERFDGTGPNGMAGSRIPLLARVLDALAAFEQDGGKSFADDAGRFDPEIVHMLASLEDAA